MKTYSSAFLISISILLLALQYTTNPVMYGLSVSDILASPALAQADNVMEVESPSAFCSSVTEIPLAECEALVALYNSTSGPTWTNHTNWLITVTPCSWYGIACVQGHVVILELSNNQLVGSIPTQLGNLSQLVQIDLNFNKLSGAIPVELGNLINLDILYLIGNQLSSNIPPALGNLTNLTTLALDNNLINGNIPPAIGNLTKLIGFGVSGNQMTGNIPSELSNLINLQSLFFNDNQFSGALPTGFVNLTKLSSFSFNNTSLCEPADDNFQSWLATITHLNRTSVMCTTSSDEFREDFSTDPNTNGHWRFYRGGTVSGEWDSQAGNMILTQSERWRKVAMFANAVVNTKGWEVSFRYRAGGQRHGVCGDSGGDGFVFMFYKEEDNYNTGSGGAMGFSGRGYGIEFDNYYNVAPCDSGTDPSPRHIALIAGGTANHLAYVNDDRVEDNQWHNVKVKFTNGTVTVEVDGGVALTHQIQNPDYTFTGIGFSSSTGNASNEHVIDDFVFKRVAATSDNFQEDFSTDPNTNGRWQIFRQANNSGAWDSNLGAFYLTRDVLWQSSIIFANYTLSSRAWNASFRFKAGGKSNGACGDQGGDGLTFFFYAKTFTPGSGRINPPEQSYGIRLDNWTGRSCDVVRGELINYIAVTKGYTVLTAVQDDRVEDHQWHTMNISFDNGKIIVSVDGAVVIDYQIENLDYTFSSIGFNAFTGGASDDHIIDDFTLASVSTDREPVIFIPGIPGSILKIDQKDKPLPLWPNFLEPDDTVESLLNALGLGTSYAEAKIILEQMAGKAANLTLDTKNPGYQKDVIAPDVIRWLLNIKLKKFDVYGSLLEETLPAAGYKPYLLTKQPGVGCDNSQTSAQPTLFVFPYDWRKPIEDSAKLLANYVACVQSLHPNEKINIVAHSMGGLVARRYILDTQQQHHIHRLITLGTPWLGTPKLLYTSLTGDFDWRVNWFFLNKDVVKGLVVTWPGAFELLPSEKYFTTEAIYPSRNFYFPPFVENGLDFNESGNNGSDETYRYPDFKRKFDQYFPVSKINEVFHKQAGQDEWANDTSGVEYYHIIGGAQNTLLQVQAKEQWTCDLVYYVVPHCYKTEFFDSFSTSNEFAGDGTVPGLSSYIYEPNISSPGISQSYYVFNSRTPNSPEKEYEHGSLVAIPKVQQCVSQILTGGACNTLLSLSQTIEAAQIYATEQYQLLIVGTGSAVVTDNAGRRTGWVDDIALVKNVPDVGYYLTGGNALRIVAPTTETLTVTFKSGITPLFIEVVKSSDNTAVQAVRYPDLVVPPNTVLALRLPLPTTAQLLYDSTGDGIADTPVSQPAVVVEGAQATDTQPPTVTITMDNARLVTVTAADPSGVKAIYYSFDETNFQPYTAPFQMPPQTTRIFAFADDMLANRSPLVSYGHPIFLPLVLSNSKFSAQNSAIAFASGERGSAGVYLMNPDGSNVRKIASFDKYYFPAHECPTWSPTGDQVAFFATSQSEFGDIYIVRTDGANLRNSTNHLGFYGNPAWSPVENLFAYSNPMFSPINVVQVDSPNSSQFGHSIHDSNPDWSPNGSHLVFASMPQGCSNCTSDIYAISRDGTSLAQLTNNAWTDWEPAWSPDGASIAFSSTRDGNSEIYLMNADGSNVRRLTNHTANDDTPTWSPDSRQLAFVSERDGNAEIYVMKADGSNPHNITNSPSRDLCPAWHVVHYPS